MSGYKEFEGKTLDEAILSACGYYDATRDKLEVDILNDAKGGIFGLVGAKKARIRAKLVEFSSVFEDLGTLADKGGQPKDRREPRSPGRAENRAENRTENSAANSAANSAEDRADAPAEPRSRSRRDERPENSRNENSRNDTPRPENSRPENAHNNAPRNRAPKPSPALAPSAEAAPAPVSGAASGDAAAETAQEGQVGGKGRGRLARSPRREKSRTEGPRPSRQNDGDAPSQPRPALRQNDGGDDADVEEFGRVPFEQLDSVALEQGAREIVSRLTESFLGQAGITVTIGNDRVRVSLTDVEDPGLLIGRDGQTLASLQYLASRILSNRMKAQIRVQIDAGDYRERQDERLREMALSLAEKVKAGGRPQVTRPLSSYHRRVIHVTLQDDPQVQTHSKGEGEMKRVMVTRRKPSA